MKRTTTSAVPYSHTSVTQVTVDCFVLPTYDYQGGNTRFIRQFTTNSQTSTNRDRRGSKTTTLPDTIGRTWHTRNTIGRNIPHSCGVLLPNNSKSSYHIKKSVYQLISPILESNNPSQGIIKNNDKKYFTHKSIMETEVEKRNHVLELAIQSTRRTIINIK